MTLPHHLVTFWNPSHATDAMDEHLAALIDWAGRARAGAETHLHRTDYRSLYVAWVGEITAEHLPREQSLCHKMSAYAFVYRQNESDSWS